MLRFRWPRLDDEDEDAVEEELELSSETDVSECLRDLRNPFPLWGNLCTARALRATFRLCSPRRAPKHTPWKRP